MSAAMSTMVSARRPPSRWSWSNAFGAWRIVSSDGDMPPSWQAPPRPSVPPVEDDVSRRLGPGRAVRGDDVTTVECCQSPLEPGRIVGVEGQQRIAGADGVAGLGMPFDSRAGLDRVPLTGSPGTEPPR